MLTKCGIYCSYLKWIYSSMEKYKNLGDYLRNYKMKWLRPRKFVLVFCSECKQASLQNLN